MKGEIKYYHDNNPIFYITIEDYEYAFSIQGFPKDRHEWLVDVVSRNMTELYERTKRNQKNEIREQFKQLMGL